MDVGIAFAEQYALSEALVNLMHVTSSRAAGEMQKGLAVAPLLPCLSRKLTTLGVRRS